MVVGRCQDIASIFNMYKCVYAIEYALLNEILFMKYVSVLRTWKLTVLSTLNVQGKGQKYKLLHKYNLHICNCCLGSKKFSLSILIYL